MAASHESRHGHAGAEEPSKTKRDGTLNGMASELEPEWMMLTLPRPMHFEHTAVDDLPGLSMGTQNCIAIMCKLCG